MARTKQTKRVVEVDPYAPPPPMPEAPESDVEPEAEVEVSAPRRVHFEEVAPAAAAPAPRLSSDLLLAAGQFVINGNYLTVSLSGSGAVDQFATQQQLSGDDAYRYLRYGRVYAYLSTSASTRALYRESDKVEKARLYFTPEVLAQMGIPDDVLRWIVQVWMQNNARENFFGFK